MNVALVLLKANIEIVKSALLALPIFKTFQLSIVELKNNENILNLVNPEYSPKQKEIILYSPLCNRDTTICYTNLLYGWSNFFDAYSFKLNFEIYACLISEGPPFEAYHFMCFKGEYKRYVLCYQDPRWVFYEKGTPLSFEDLTFYKSKYKKKRLNKNVIIRYLQHVGWNLEDENIWHTAHKIYKIQQIQKLPKVIKSELLKCIEIT